MYIFKYDGEWTGCLFSRQGPTTNALKSSIHVLEEVFLDVQTSPCSKPSATLGRLEACLKLKLQGEGDRTKSGARRMMLSFLRRSAPRQCRSFADIRGIAMDNMMRLSQGP